MEIVSKKSVDGVVTDLWNGTKKAALLLATVATLFYILRTMNYDRVTPSTISFNEKVAHCVTCHYYDPRLMINYEPKKR
ncbi:hypothetical protein J4410_03070 [Candidatus Woesearchaeota archaeon]|nr:hypothetical protein [Candidatus Woesearchaeota archaeon]